MVRRVSRAGNRVRVRFGTQAELLAGGVEVRALRYQRASQDKKEQGKSVHDQGGLNVKEITSHGWTDAGSFTDNDRSASRHATKEREKFELRDKNDRMMLGFQAVQAEWMADSIRDNVLRGIVGAAEAGRPHGTVTYGYRRIYHQRTKALERQEPDTEIRTATAEDGTVTEYSHAGVVREIFEEVSGGTPLITIEQSLNARGIPSPRGARWLRGIIRKIATNPAYIGKRVFRGEVVGDGIWPALVDEEIYWAVRPPVGRSVPDDHPRGTGRPLAVVHRVVWGVWWAGLLVQRVPAWLVRAGLLLSEEAHARAEAERLHADLEDYKKLAEAGQVKAIDFVRISKGLEAQIAEHEARAAEAGIPPVLRGRIGPQAVTAWAELGDEVGVKREIIRTVAGIKLLPARHKGDRSTVGRLSDTSTAT